MEEILFVVIIALIIYLLFQNSHKTNNINRNDINNNDIKQNIETQQLQQLQQNFAEKQVNKTTELKVLNDPNDPDNFVEINQLGEPVFSPFIYDRLYNPLFYPYYSYYSYEPRPIPIYNVEYDLYNPYYRNYRYYNKEYNHLKRIDRRDGDKHERRDGDRHERRDKK